MHIYNIVISTKLNMNRICLNVLVGVPASGKTTYCKHIETTRTHTFNVVHVCYDSFIRVDAQYDLFSNDTGSYKLRRKKLLSLMETIIVAVKENDREKLENSLTYVENEFGVVLKISLSTDYKDYLFVIDDNMYYRSMRLEWLKVAKKLSLGFFQTFFDIPLALALQRNQARISPIQKEVVVSMWIRLEKPCGDLHQWEKQCICFRETYDMNTAIELAKYCIKTPVQGVIKIQSVPMEQSKVHQIDLLLRKRISKRMARAKETMPSNDLEVFAHHLQKQKANLLDQLRKGECCRPDVVEKNIQIIADTLF
ncbi:L-seryl-tRNA(Sec) kinase [Anopheles bellator]|uniref:L-seryl-tRNA(Sec) kinase n=1 Tax=Anopheles bellator TaxID=139047 RepID=UPI0026497E7E|nr:L-seryl-tRNA(Sec) kinase [Anopheles bellator]